MHNIQAQLHQWSNPSWLTPLNALCPEQVGGHARSSYRARDLPLGAWAGHRNKGKSLWARSRAAPVTCSELKVHIGRGIPGVHKGQRGIPAVRPGVGGREAGRQPYARNRCLPTARTATARVCQWHGRPPAHPTQISLAVGTTRGPMSADRTALCRGSPHPRRCPCRQPRPLLTALPQECMILDGDCVIQETFLVFLGACSGNVAGCCPHCRPHTWAAAGTLGRLGQPCPQSKGAPGPGRPPFSITCPEAWWEYLWGWDQAPGGGILHLPTPKSGLAKHCL